MARIIGFIQRSRRALTSVGVDVANSACRASAIAGGTRYTTLIEEGTTICAFAGGFRLRPGTRLCRRAAGCLDVRAIDTFLAIDGTVIVGFAVLDAAGWWLAEAGGATDLTGAAVVWKITGVAPLFHTGSFNKTSTGGAGFVVNARLGLFFDTNPVG